MPYADPAKAAEHGRGRCRSFYARNREAQQARGLALYGLTPEAYDALLKAQDGTCAGCADEFTATPLVDHCHATGAIRGLLCRRCNTALGLAKDSVATLRRLAIYLDK